MLGTAMYVLDNSDFLPPPGWQMQYDCWAVSQNMPLMPHSAATYANDYKTQVMARNGITAPALPRLDCCIRPLKSEKLLLCPDDMVNAGTYARLELISSYVWDGAIVGFGTTPQVNGQYTTFKMSKLHASNILQWENDEKAPRWNDLSNYPSENNFLTFSQRHGKTAQVGRLDGPPAFR